MPETCTIEDTYVPSSTVQNGYIQTCFNPLQFQIFVILGVSVFIIAVAYGWKMLKVQ